ncbi:MAG TPA: hypothetical protein DCZ92_09835 [Elusimicrobia bacterium]|nr:MAG: hypothetical protein A2016_05345 [Elusimicrobia bacterium GWF2_62_30]HBA61100.1 hypothetical protein [Elusimicrobiota bacterium]
MNRTFERYIARSFWAPFGFGLAVFCLLLVFGSMFDKLNFFMKSSSGAGLFLRYIAYQTPYFAVKMIPIAVLLAVLFALGGMISSGEWKAGLAGGWRPLAMIKPLIFCAVLAGAGQLLLQETVAPEFYMRSEFLFEGKMRGREDWKRVVKRDVTFSAGDEVFVTASLFDGRRRLMERVVLDAYRGGRLFTEVNARSASWRADVGRWEFYDGVEISYDEDAVPAVRHFPKWLSSVSVPPEDLLLEKLVPDGVHSLEVLRRLRRLEAVGAPATAERTLLWVKLAAPLASPVMALIGAAIVLLLPRNNKLFSFGLSIGTGFFFWAVIIMAQQAGNAELVPPAVAGLAPCVIFTLVSLWGLKRARGF